MSSVSPEEGASDNFEHLEPYSVEFNDKEMIVNGPDLKVCQKIAQDVKDGKKVVLKLGTKQVLVESKNAPQFSRPSVISASPNLIGDPESKSSLPSNSSKAKTSKSGTNGDYAPKIRSEPGNSWLQFCRIKKNKAMIESGDKEAHYNRSEAQREWREMSNEEKSFYVELAQCEKLSLGDNYRAGRVRKKKDKLATSDIGLKKTFKKKTLKPRVVPADSKSKKDPSVDAAKFVENLVKLDEEIDKQEELNCALTEELSNAKVTLAVHQCKLNQLNVEVEKAAEKYNMIVKQHACCKSSE